MKQKTAKSVEDVLEWLETTAHHYAAADEEPGFFILKGHGEKLRIPNEIQVLTFKLVKPGEQFDTRMFRANKAGRHLLAKSKKENRP